MVRATALDLSREGVRVNAINPGFIEAELAFSVAAQAPNLAQALAERRAMHPIPAPESPRRPALPRCFSRATDLASSPAR
jgi:NAD(P)-dependent dehydrogenase (short-subunit alcohol dehydrogenase family)